jgi:D-alanyl-D-alanine dipeptidase
MKLLKSFLFFFIIAFLVAFSIRKENKLPKSFVDVSQVIPNLKMDLRYVTSHNFVGKPIDGYKSQKCFLTKEAASALKKVEGQLAEQGMCLFVYDSYRPKKAVNHFVRWARNLNDTLMKSEFYPNVNKKDLFKLGYISSKSRHSSGSTIDLTIFSDEINDVIDMGSKYDFFGKESWVKYDKLSSEQMANRKLLQTVMLVNGFRSYPQEWWHFTLRYEPYRNAAFDFNVE